MSNIPRARDLLEQGLARGDATSMRAAIEEALTLMVRKSPTRRGRVKKARMTATLRDKIRRSLVEHPAAHLDEIAALHNVNMGRVSEVKDGIWDEL